MQGVKKHDTMVTKEGRVICPLCGRPTQHRVLSQTRAVNLPIWCKLCRQESIVNIQSLSQSHETSA